MRKIFVTGIGTDVGKTVVAALLAEALKADYWKPIQTGAYHYTDSDMIRQLISNPQTVIHPESYCLQAAKSPHEAAELEKVRIDFAQINLPPSANQTLIIEGAGGVMVPLNEKYFVIDLIKKFDAETIVVVQNYLGSINHSLLTIDALKQRKIKITGLVFNGVYHQPSHEIILNHSKLPVITWLNKEMEMNKEVIQKYVKDFENI